MFYSCIQSPVIVEVNTHASKRTELIVNAAFCMALDSVIPFNSYVPVVVKVKVPNNFLHILV